MTNKNEPKRGPSGTLSARAPKPRSTPVPQPEFNEALMRRVKELRVAAGLTQTQVAEALGIPWRTYQHFEYRSPLPAALIVPFADLVGADVRYVLTGEKQRRAA